MFSAQTWDKWRRSRSRWRVSTMIRNVRSRAIIRTRCERSPGHAMTRCLLLMGRQFWRITGQRRQWRCLARIKTTRGTRPEYLRKRRPADARGEGGVWGGTRTKSFARGLPRQRRVARGRYWARFARGAAVTLFGAPGAAAGFSSIFSSLHQRSSRSFSRLRSLQKISNICFRWRFAKNWQLTAYF